MRYIVMIAGIFLGEFQIKNHAEKQLTQKTEKRILRGRIHLRNYHNRGACLNLGEKRPPAVALLSVLLTLLTLILFVFSLGQKGNALLRTGLAILLGGAFSNTYDRLVRKYVVDYFSFQTGIAALDRVVFNLADFAILFGALAAALSTFSE